MWRGARARLAWMCERTLIYNMTMAMMARVLVCERDGVGLALRAGFPCGHAQRLSGRRQVDRLLLDDYHQV